MSTDEGTVECRVTTNRQILQVAPLPVAQILARAWTGKSATERHNAAFYAFEATIKLATAAHIARWLATDPEQTDPVFRAFGALERGSLGHWVAVFRSLHAPDQAEPLEAGIALAERLAKSDVGPADGAREVRKRGLVGLFGVVVAYRNAVFGHGSQRREGFYAELEHPLREAVAEVLAQPTTLGGTLVLVDEPCLDLTGPVPLHHDPIPCDFRGPAILGPQGEVWSLSPLVAHDESATLGRHRIGYLNKVVRGRGASQSVSRVEYLDYATGATLRVGAAEAVQRFFAISRTERSGSSGSGAGPAVGRDSGAQLGPYRLDEELGRGAMGVVYAARHVQLGTRVALKVLSDLLVSDPVARTRFEREIRALARCDHPNVVTVIDADASADRPFYAMEFVDGADLAHPGEPFAPTVLAALAADAADGLHALHQQGVVHRDLKPANLMCTADRSRIVVMDLGLARLDDASRGLSESSGKVLGTLRYMPPEQLREGDAVDARADVYALGASLFEVLAARPLVTGQRPEQLMRAVLLERRPRLREFVPDAPQGLEDVLHKATAFEPSQRYATAAEMARDLRLVGEGGRPLAMSAAHVHAGRLRRRLVPILAVSLAIATISGVAAWVWDTHQEKVRRYPGIEWVHGVPTGVGSSASPSRAFEITERGGRVLRVRHVTAQGASLPWSTNTTPDMMSSSEGRDWLGGLLYPCNERGTGSKRLDPGACWDTAMVPPVGVEVAYSAEGFATELRWLDPTDRVVALDRMEQVGDGLITRRTNPQGLPVDGWWGSERRFDSLDAHGRRLSSRYELADGGLDPVLEVTQVRFAYRPDGRTLSTTVINDQGEPLDGQITGFDLEYSADGLPIRKVYRDGSGTPTAGSTRCASFELGWHSDGSLAHSRCLDHTGAPTTDTAGCATRAFTSRGDWHIDRCLGVDGTPSAVTLPDGTVGGWSELQVRVDSRGLPVEARFLDVLGQPMSPQLTYENGTFDGPARLIGARDGDGWLTEVHWKGADGQPMPSPHGWWGWRTKIDAAGLVSDLAFLGPEGEGVEDNNGVGRQILERDEHGLLIRLRNFDALGQPVISAASAHGLDLDYQLGSPVSKRYFGLDEQPAFGADGFHETRWHSDAEEGRFETSWWGISGEPMLSVDGSHHMVVAHRQGAEQTYRWLDTLHQPVAGPRGCPVLVEDTRGGSTKRITSRCFDSAGEPLDHLDGSAVSTKYVAGGREIRTTRVAADGRVLFDRTKLYDVRGDRLGWDEVAANGEISRWRVTHDSDGRVVQRSWVDADGALTDDESWYAAWKVQYGLSSRSVWFEHADGSPAVFPNRDLHRTQEQLDAKGRILSRAGFGADGEPIGDQAAVHKATRRYDVRGNMVFEERLAVPGQRLPSSHAPRLHLTYGPRNQITSVRHTHLDDRAFDIVEDGQLYSTANVDYDDRGRLLGFRIRNADGSPALCPAGYSDIVVEWGDQSVMFWFGKGEERVDLGAGRHWLGFLSFALLEDLMLEGVHPDEIEGAAGWSVRHDDWGRSVALDLFNAAGEPVAFDGASGVRYVWAPHGDLAHREWVDLDGRRTTPSRFAVARVEWEYAPGGWVVRKSFLDEELRLVNGAQSGFAESRVINDGAGNPLRTTLWYADGRPAHYRAGASLPFHWPVHLPEPEGCHDIELSFTGDHAVAVACADQD